MIPIDERGLATLENFPFGSYEDFMAYYSGQDQSQSVSFMKGKMEILLFLFRTD